MFVAMNRFRVVPEQEGEWERIWKERETYLQEVPGFVQFALLRSDEAGEYISHSIWRDRSAFEAWTRSAAFRKGHAQGSLHGVLAGSPELGLFQAVLWEEAGREREDDASDPVAGRQGPRH
jgi:heme-degrading monooxygenase HmoA